MTLQVFISYKSEYRDFARAVKSELNQWGFQTWLDVDNIQPGDYFRHKIQAGLDSSDVLLMVLTEEAQLSREVMSEVDYFLDVAKKPVVPLLHQACKPLYIFVSIQYIDFIADQANGFVQLKQRLSELAASMQPVTTSPVEVVISPAKPDPPPRPGKRRDEREEKPAATSDAPVPPPSPEPMPQEAEEKNESASDDYFQQDKEKKKERLDDGLFDLAASPTAAPQVKPPPPAPPISEAIGTIQAPSNSPVVHPQRQPSAPMAQPAAPHSKSSPVLWPLAAVASLVLIVGVLVVFSSSTNVSSTSEAGVSPLLWVVALAVISVVGVWGWRRYRSDKTGERLRPAPAEDAKNREMLLNKVEEFCLKNLDRVMPAEGIVLRHKDYGDYALPPNANILNVFNDMNRELLILGAPEAGKTVLLLQLARELIQQVRHDTGKAIPVVFNLAPWAAERKPLSDWLVDELRLKYQVPNDVSKAWIEGEKLLLLLDDLDEVAEQYRDECVEVINAFREKYRTVDWTLGARVTDYDRLTSKLDVRGAITIK